MLLADEVLSCLTIVKFMSTSLGFWCKGWPLKVQIWIPPPPWIPPPLKKTYSLPLCFWQTWRVFSFDQHRTSTKLVKSLISQKWVRILGQSYWLYGEDVRILWIFVYIIAHIAIKMFALFWWERIFNQNCQIYSRFRC